jgi:hypothetical protein
MSVVAPLGLRSQLDKDKSVATREGSYGPSRMPANLNCASTTICIDAPVWFGSVWVRFDLVWPGRVSNHYTSAWLIDSLLTSHSPLRPSL